MCPVGKYGLVVGQGRDARPGLLGRRLQHAEDAEQLVDLRVALEQWPLGHHLGKDAGQRPDVDRAGVASRSEKDLGRSVPERYDFVGVDADGDAESAA